MGAAIIPSDKTKDPVASVVSALRGVRDSVRKLGDARQVMVAECNGTTDTAAHFAALAVAGGFAAGDYADANTAAMTFFQQIDSLYQIFTKPSGQGDAAGAALSQACGMIGVI